MQTNAINWQSLDAFPQLGQEPQVVVVGVFDGVHRGHQALLQEAVRIAGETKATVTALTFDPHPTQVFAPARVPPLLGTLDERALLLRSYGAMRVVVVPFDRKFAAQTAEQFVSDVLRRCLNAHAVVVGEDFRFGCDRSGNVAFLRDAGERLGFTVHTLAPVFVDGVPARSTAVRQLIAGGLVREAERLLGHSYCLSGTVERGKQLGRTLGFPTANLAMPKNILIPGPGVYAGYAHLHNGETYRTAISIGTNPTVTPDNRVHIVEAYLMDGFDGDLYGQALSLDFTAFLRPTLKFTDLPTLVVQMRQDVAQAADILAM